MKIGIIGTGRMGRALATIWLAQGHELMLGSRSTATSVDIDVAVGTIGETAVFGDIIVLAVPWYAIDDVLAETGKMADKIVIDCINPVMSSGSLAVGHKRSAGEMIQQMLPLAKVVKAFNGIYVSHLANPTFSGQPADVFYCTNFDKAGVEVATLITEMGFNPIYCGPMKMARYIEPMAVFWIQMAFHYGQGPEFAIKFVPR